MQTSDSLLPKNLREILEGMPKIAVAFSGGLDSRFLCYAAKLCGCDVLAIHASGPHISVKETQFAKHWANDNNISFIDIPFDPLSLTHVAKNDRRRCYECKRTLFSLISQTLAEKGETQRILCDGGNLDDYDTTRCFRPGVQAVIEAGIISPLARACLRKSQIHALARATRMSNSDQKARPCLLTRLAYGMSPDKKTLSILTETEDELEMLLAEQSPKIDFRIRLLPEPVLQLTEAPKSRYYNDLLAIMHAHGFTQVDIQIMPELSGFYDREFSTHQGKRDLDFS